MVGATAPWIAVLLVGMFWLSLPRLSGAAPRADAGTAGDAGNCTPDTVQPNGALYRFCLPPGWESGGLFVYAHGYRWFNEPLVIPEDHICFGEPGEETCINDLVNDAGLAFAATSYPRNGLAVLPAVEDVVNVVRVFSATYGAPAKVYIGGVSEGGLVTTLAVERHPDVFDGGVAACGPIGDWPAQINYFGDFRVLFDYFFPSLLPARPLTISNELIEAWGSGAFWEEEVAPVLFDPTSALSLTQLLETSRLPYEPGVTDTIRLAVHDALAYNIMATNEVSETLGGNPFDNRERLYSGSLDDDALNAAVARYTASPEALAAMEAYQTSGNLTRPLVTLHTTRDQQVPHWHEVLYGEKVRAAGAHRWHVDYPMAVDQYGHCQFDVERELLPAFFRMLSMVAEPPPARLYLPLVR